MEYIFIGNSVPQEFDGPQKRSVFSFLNTLSGELYSTDSASTEDSGNYSCIAFSRGIFPDYPEDFPEEADADILDYPIDKRAIDIITSTRNITVIVEGTE